MTTPVPSWTSILYRITRSTTERKRLATALGMSEMTLIRWSNGESNPQRPHLARLLKVMQPDHREELINALESTYTDIHSWLKDNTSEQIPSHFFAQVLNIRTTTTDGLRFWRISDMVLKQALQQLDPNNLGMSVKLIQCMPPSKDGKIRTLRERGGKGTSPWTADLEHDVHFLGLESLSGYAVESRHVVSYDDLRESKPVPAYKGEFEISAAAHPIRLEGRVAGCLLASSTQEGYFTQHRITQLATFSDLISLAFDKHEFYPINSIELRFVTPDPEKQQKIISTFRQRVTKKCREAAKHYQHLSNPDVELQVWQEIEQELLDVSDKEEPPE